MADPRAHPGDDELVGLALGTLPHDDARAVLAHLAGCPACRGEYDDLVRAVDTVLPASPTVAPPAGFEARVLDRLDARVVRRPRMTRRTAVLVTAASVAGLAMGGLVTATLRPAEEAAPAAYPGAVLRTDDGDGVGSVRSTLFDDRSVLVIQVDAGPPGAHYRCVIRLADGSSVPAGEWTVPASGRALWIAALPESGAERVELVTDAGQVWSAAPLD